MKPVVIIAIASILFIPIDVFAIEYNEYGQPKTYLKGNFHGCEDGLWIGSFEVEGTGEKIETAQVYLFDEKGFQTKTKLHYIDGTLRISPDGNDDYPPIEYVLIRSAPHEDFSFSPICFELPDWIKSTALWWATDVITDEDFVLMIQFLIENQIIVVSQSEVISSSNDGIPTWIKTSAQWWAEDKIDDMTFLKSIEFLVSSGIIIISTNDEVEEDVNSATATSYEEGFSGLYCKQDGNWVQMTGKYTNGPNAYSSIFFKFGVLDSQDRVVATGLTNINNVSPYQTKMFEANTDWSGDFKECIIEVHDAFP